MDSDVKPDDFLNRYDFTFGTNLILSFPHLELRHLEALPPHVVEGRQNVAYLAWELAEGNRYWAENYRRWDQIWALSEFSAAALRQSLDRDVLSVPCILDCERLPEPASKADFGLDSSRFTVLFVFSPDSSTERKNPEAVIESFCRAFGSDKGVQLVIRVANAYRTEHRDRLRELARAAAESRIDVRFLTQAMRHRDLLRLISACDAYISLHRAEGFGYTCAEAMAYGKPTIATGYSGNLEFMTEENSYLVDYTLAEIRRPEGPFCRGQIWAEPDIDHAAAHLREIRSDPRAAQLRARQGQRDVRQLLAPARIGQMAARALGSKTVPVATRPEASGLAEPTVIS